MEKFKIHKTGSQATQAMGKADVEFRVLKLDLQVEPVVQQYKFGQVTHGGQGDYAATKKKFGALAATDPDRAAKSKKDSRFQINSTLRNTLAIEEEERRAIEDTIRKRVEELSEKVKAEAHEKGYADGLQQGRTEAYGKVLDEMAERLASFEQLLRNFEEAKDAIYKANERFLMELIYRIAKMIVLKEVAVDRELVLRLARQVIEQIGVREHIRVHVHPKDVETIGLMKESLEKSLGKMKNLHVETSGHIELGGCRVETEWNSIDATIETQLKKVYEVLLSAGANAPQNQESS